MRLGLIIKKRRDNDIFIILLLVVGLYSIGSGAFEFFLPLLLNDLVENVMVVGFLLSLPSLFSLFFDVPLGDLSDKLGITRVLLFCLFFMAVIGALFQYASVLSLLFLLVFWGILNQLWDISSTAHVVDLSPKKEAAEYFGFYTASKFFGFAVGPIIGGLFLSNQILSVPYLYSLICLVSFTIVALMFKKRLTRSGSLATSVRELIQKDKVFIKEIADFKKLRSRGLLSLYLAFVVNFCGMLVLVFEPIYLQSISTNPLLGGLVLSSFLMSFAVSNIPAGILADKYGKYLSTLIGLTIAGIFLILFGFSVSPYVLMLFAFVSSFGLALVFSAAGGLLVEVCPSYEEGEVSGIWNLAEDLGYFFGPLLGGLVAQVFGLGSSFLFAGAVLIISIFPLFLFFKDF